MKSVNKSLNERDDGGPLLGAGLKMGAARLLSVMTGVALSVLLARALRAEGYGLYLYVLAIAHILAMPALMGLPTLLTRQVAVYRAQTDWSAIRGVWRWSLWFLALSTSLIALFASFWFAFMSGYASGGVVLWVVPFVAVFGVMQLLAALLNGFEHPVAAALPDGLIRPVLLLGLAGMASVAGLLTPATAMGLHVLACAGAALWAWRAVHRLCRSPLSGAQSPPRFDGRAWFSGLWPLSLVAAAAIINSRLDIYMLGLIGSHEQVAVYGLAFQMAGLLMIGTTIFYGIAAPRMARLGTAGDVAALQTLVTRAARYGFAVTLVAYAALAVLAGPVLQVLVGPEFGASARLALIIGAGSLFAAFMGPASLALSMRGQERLTMKVFAAMAATNAVLNLLLIPRYGPTGAALATIGALVVNHCACVLLAARRLDLRTTVLGTGGARLG